MKSLGYYLSTLQGERQELIDTLSKKGIQSDSADSLSSLVDKTNLLDFDESLHFISSQDIITIHLLGKGKIKIYGNKELISEVVLQESNTVTVEINNPLGNKECNYYFDTLEGISEIDLHSNSIVSLSIGEKNEVKKIVAYDNQLSWFDCSKCMGLQFLHIHNNPLCDDSEAIKATINSLVDRAKTSTGSVIFYPWFGLETLIEEYSGTYKKYPYLPDNVGNYSNPSSMHYSWIYNSNGSYKFEEGRLYGVVSLQTGADNRDEIKQYRVYKNGQLLSINETDSLSDYKNINFYQNLRKNELEKISLKKNWVFGSAIIYNESEWAKCPWDFRQNNVADMWETTEKGFGYTLGTADVITLLFPGAQFLNVVSYNNLWNTSPDYTNVSYPLIENFLRGDSTHGDFILSIVSGNGSGANYGPTARFSKVISGTIYSYKGAIDGIRYGYAPLAKLVLIDKTPASVNGVYYGGARQLECMAELTQLGCDTITSSSGSPNYAWDDKTKYPTEEDWINHVFLDTTSSLRKSLQVFADKGIYTAPAGNTSDGKPYTEDSDRYYDAMYGTNNESYMAEGELPCRTLFIQALDWAKDNACYSRNSPHCTRAKLSTIDYMTQYGSSIPVQANILAGNEIYYTNYYTSGTSFSSPMLCAMLLLLRIIYSKFDNADKSSFGKLSPFMDYVRERWCDCLENQMDFSVGYGMPNVLALPLSRKFIESDSGSATKKGYVLRADLGECVQTRNGNVYSIRQPDLSAVDMASKSNIQLGSVDSSFKVVDHAMYKVSEVTFTDCFHNKDIVPLTTTIPFNTEPEQDIYAGSSYEVFKMNLESRDLPTEYTISFLVDLKPSTILDVDIGGDAKEVTVNTNILFLKGSEFTRIMRGGNWSYKPNDDKFISMERLVYSLYRFTEDSLVIPSGSEPLIPKIEGFIEKYTKAVFTITVDEKFINTYFNGRHISAMKMDELNDFDASGVAINKVSLVDNSSSYIYGYDRVLSEEEIVENTAAILKIGDNL